MYVWLYLHVLFNRSISPSLLSPYPSPHPCPAWFIAFTTNLRELEMIILHAHGP